MIDALISVCLRNRAVVLLGAGLVAVLGIWALSTTPVDAIPDLSDNQIIVCTDWDGRSPETVQDQVTHPIAASLHGLPGVRAVRTQTMFGASMVYVVFDDGVDPARARAGVSERLSRVSGQLPPGVMPMLGPDGSGVGHVFWYTLRSRNRDLGELRSIQDWYLRAPLSAVPGVAEIASIGGFQKEYQIDLDPAKLQAWHVPLKSVLDAVSMSNSEAGGDVVDRGASERQVRGRAYLASRQDIENIVVSAAPGGIPVSVKDLGVVQMGGAPRRGLLEENGEGETVGGIVVMRSGENAKQVIARVKARLDELARGLPAGVTIQIAYDRSGLIDRAVSALSSTVVEEIILVILAHVLFLWHFRSILIVTIPLPLSILIAFLFMRAAGMTSNIMSLGGIAIAVGVLVDAGIVIAENAIRNAERHGEGYERDILAIVERSAHRVGRPIFFAMAIVVLAFVPVFALRGTEGKMFHPLAFTKTFAMAASAALAVTLVPVLCSLLVRGRLHPEENNRLMRALVRLYRPALEWALAHRVATVAAAASLLAVALVLSTRVGSEFMPRLDEGSLLFMPTTAPGISVSEAKRLVTLQDRIIRATPEVEYVLGKVGRADTATDPAPVSMFETLIRLKPREQWRRGMTTDKLIAELDGKLRIPGVGNGWTMPIINRIDMLSTGVRTDLGLKIYGADASIAEALAGRAAGVLENIPGAEDVYVDREQAGNYLDIDLDRAAAARHGLNAAAVNDTIETALGGRVVTHVVEGQARVPVRVRFLRDYRQDIDAIRRLPVATTSSMSASAMGAISEPAYIPQAMDGSMSAMPMSSAMAPMSGITGSMHGMSMGTTPDARNGAMAGNSMSGASMGAVPYYPPDNAQPAAASLVAHVPLEEVATIRDSAGPAMIETENSSPRSVVYLNVRGRDLGGFVDEARRRVAAALALPPGYFAEWSGQYENQLHARHTLEIVTPIVLATIFILLVVVYRSTREAMHVLLAAPFALSGGLLAVYLGDWRFSVAVWVGFIALFGTAVQTAIVMVVYLEEAVERVRWRDGKLTRENLREAVIAGALLRLRPKVMTVSTILAGLIPIFWSDRTGAEVMRPIAAPVVGGMISSLLHVLILTPVLFLWLRERDLAKSENNSERRTQWQPMEVFEKTF